MKFKCHATGYKLNNFSHNGPKLTNKEHISNLNLKLTSVQEESYQNNEEKKQLNCKIDELNDTNNQLNSKIKELYNIINDKVSIIKIDKTKYETKHNNLLETHNKCIKRIEHLKNNSINIESGDLMKCMKLNTNVRFVTTKPMK